MFYVYTYSFGGVPRYVGKGVGSRWAAHRKPYRKGRLGEALRAEFASSGIWIEPTFEYYETAKEANTAEIAKIAAIGRECKSEGPLWNIAKGGQGGSGSRKQTEATKERIRQSLTGRRHSEETKAKLAKIMLNRDPEIYERVSRSCKGKPKSEETKARMRAASLVREANKRKERQWHSHS